MLSATLTVIKTEEIERGVRARVVFAAVDDGSEAAGFDQKTGAALQKPEGKHPLIEVVVISTDPAFLALKAGDKKNISIG